MWLYALRGSSVMGLGGSGLHSGSRPGHCQASVDGNPGVSQGVVSFFFFFFLILFSSFLSSSPLVMNSRTRGGRKSHGIRRDKKFMSTPLSGEQRQHKTKSQLQWPACGGQMYHVHTTSSCSSQPVRTWSLRCFPYLGKPAFCIMRPALCIMHRADLLLWFTSQALGGQQRKSKR